ncbi:MAG TPA: PspC domain-containing protein, partial [Propionicimonas sp.]|nr:PspC domain-containing protein [Propionicimonas sp.]
MTVRDDRSPAQSGESANGPVSSGPASTELQPRSTRPLNAAWVGGVCAGLADHLGWSVLLLRVVAVVLGATGLVGVAIYVALWLVMPPSAERRSAPGLEANARRGLRPRGSVTLSPV